MQTSTADAPWDALEKHRMSSTWSCPNGDCNLLPETKYQTKQFQSKNRSETITVTRKRVNFRLYCTCTFRNIYTALLATSSNEQPKYVFCDMEMELSTIKRTIVMIWPDGKTMSLEDRIRNRNWDAIHCDTISVSVEYDVDFPRSTTTTFHGRRRTAL